MTTHILVRTKDIDAAFTVAEPAASLPRAIRQCASLIFEVDMTSQALIKHKDKLGIFQTEKISTKEEVLSFVAEHFCYPLPEKVV